MTYDETKMRLEDLWEHLTSCYEQWQDADAHEARTATNFLLRDLDQCRRLCESIGTPPM